MDPVTLTTERLLLRTVGPHDTDAVYAAAQDPEIQRRLATLPSPYQYEHARGFTERLVPDGWRDGSMFTFGVFLPTGELTGMLSVSMRSLGVAEIGFWAIKEHRRNGYVTEAVLAAARWVFLALAVDRLEWRAEVGNVASRAVAEKTGFTIEGVLRSAVDSRGVRRDCWLGSLLPSDLGLPPTTPYLPSEPRARLPQPHRVRGEVLRRPGSGRTSEPETTSTRPDLLVSHSRAAGEPQSGPRSR